MIARFRQRHERPLAELFGEVLALCARGRLGSRRGASPSTARSCTPTRRSARRAATRTSRARSFRPTRRPSTPRRTSASAMRVATQLPSRAGHRSGPPAVAARRQSVASTSARAADGQANPEVTARPAQGGQASLEEEHAGPSAPRQARPMRTTAGTAACAIGRRLGAHSPAEALHASRPCRRARSILTDPDSRNVKTPRGWVQGYNAQAVTHRGPDRHRRRSARLVGRLRPARADGRRGAPRARARRPSMEAPRRRARRRRRTGTRSRCSASPARRIDGARSARRQQARRRPARLEQAAAATFMRRVLGHRRGRRALRQAPGGCIERGLRRHQVQPRRRPLLTPRPRQPHARNGGSPTPPTTCSSSGDHTRGARCPPEAPARAPLLQTRFR